MTIGSESDLPSTCMAAPDSSPRTFAIRGGIVLDTGRTRRADVVVHQGRIAAVLEAGDDSVGRVEVTLDASGCLVMPGLVDIQVHFREPGPDDVLRHAEDIASGSLGAVRGGMTAVLMMPNTTPPIDRVDVVRDVMRRARSAPLDVRTAAALTIDRAGTALVDFDALHREGVRVFTDDGDSLMNSALMRDALLAATRLPGMVVSQHAEDAALVAGGAVNAGPVAEQLGVGGRPAVAEEIVVARDLALVRETGGRYHVLHMSSGGTASLVAQAKANGLPVTCEVTPQHLVLTQEDVPRLRGDGKMNPPLRTAADVAALRRGLAEDLIDAIATDHAPHPPAQKAAGVAAAPPGMLGTETAAAVVWTHLVHTRVISPAQAVAALSLRPARIAGFEEQGRPVEAGEPANLCVFDPERRWVVDARRLASRATNSPFHGQELHGAVRYTVCKGKITHRDDGRG